MKFLDEHFKELDDELKMTRESKVLLRSKIMKSADKRKVYHNKRYFWVTAAICFLFLMTSPFYSPTMASLAAKILPITITPSFPDGENNPSLTTQLFELVEQAGYTANYVGISPSPYTIEISIILKDTTLEQAKENLEPTLESFLYENGYDKYELKILEGEEIPPDNKKEENNILYDKVREIVKEVFTSYGYAKEADYELAGLKAGKFSNIVTLDMPDHINESADIIEELENQFESRNLDVKEIEVSTFNLNHRIQDYRWAYIASDIYNGMAGKSTYQLNGVSYKVRKGHSYVSLKTDFENPPSEEIVKEIELAIREYFALPETKDQIQNDDYTIQLLLKNKESFIKITK